MNAITNNINKSISRLATHKVIGSLLACLLLSVLLAVTLPAAAQKTPTPRRATPVAWNQGQVAYLRYDDDNNTFGLIIIGAQENEIDSLRSPILTGITADSVPRWSPKIANYLFTAQRGHAEDIFVYDGKTAKNLTNSPEGSTASNISAAWSPDGTRIAFASDRDKAAGQFEIYVMEANGRKILRLTRSGSGIAYNPVWMPDGNSILFSYKPTPDAKPEMHTIKSDGSREFPFLPADDYLGIPQWSPNGKMIATLRQVEADIELVTISADGTQIQPLLRYTPTMQSYISFLNTDAFPNNALLDTFVWSPDSSQIAISLPFLDQTRLYTVDVKSGNKQPVSDNKAFEGPHDDRMPSWSADGRVIYFSTQVIGSQHYDVYRVNADGTNLTRITATGWDSLRPTWSMTFPAEF